MLWRWLEKKEVSPKYIRVIKDIYEGGMTSVRTLGGVTNDFVIGMGLHQSSILSLFPSILVIDELINVFKMNYHVVCYSQMILFLLMRLERELIASWSD